MTSGAHRKVVTVLFCDVVGSTALGESVDPEALQGLLVSYFEQMKGIVESHGGAVEKFIGDAVMAVFGVPVAHEDDALRACRAAVEMCDVLPELGVQGRIGVNSGEVLTGTEERLATGDAVNVAARLEQAAQPDEVLIGEQTFALVRDAVDVEEAGQLELKGKTASVAAYRLLGVRDAPERQHDAPFVGRERELEVLRDAWKRAQAEERCELVTIVGDAGVGKSRLATETLAAIDATVVRGRCPPYGDGITYWPVVEVLKQLGKLPAEETAAAAIRSLLGQTDAATSAEEIAWAFRKTLERAAADLPLVVVFDDIQWGEETFLDLIEHVALLSSGAPILLLCLARSELAERRPTWPVVMRLEPLRDDDVEELIPERITGAVRARIARAAGGNPLFVQEMLVMAGEADGEIVVPPTLQALLAARLDQLETAERSVLERGAVEGEVFHRGAVQALAPSEAQVTPRLAALARKELIRPDKPQIAGEDGFRFRHLLIRDAAYEGLPKSTRAELHERFADWLVDRGAELVELNEILGYHLEQAYCYGVELGAPKEELGRRAATRLAAAGRRAQLRGDLTATINLLERSRRLLRDEQQDVALEVDLGDALFSAGLPVQAEELLRETAARAANRGDGRGMLLARLTQMVVLLSTDPEGRAQEARVLAAEAIPVFEAAGDERGLMRAWTAIGWVEHNLCRYGARNAAYERALLHAKRAGDERLAAWLTSSIGVGYVFGPASVEEGLRRYALQPDSDPGHLGYPNYLARKALLESMLGRFDVAREMLAEARARKEELGQGFELARQGETWWFLAMRAGDPAAAVAALRESCEVLERMGERGVLSTQAGELGHALCALGCYDEAEEWARKSRELGASDDIVTQMLWRQVLSKVKAQRRAFEEGERLAREAVQLGEQTDMLVAIGLAHLDLAEVLELAGRRSEAVAELTKALELFDRKGDLPMAAQARTRLEVARMSVSALE